MKEKELVKEIYRHKKLYYAGTPEISDFEYDKLEDRLRELNPDSRVLQVVGAEVVNSRPKFRYALRAYLYNRYVNTGEDVWIDKRFELSLLKKIILKYK